MRYEEANLEAIYNMLEDEADRAERVADLADKEANRLEWEVKDY